MLACLSNCRAVLCTNGYHTWQRSSVYIIAKDIFLHHVHSLVMAGPAMTSCHRRPLCVADDLPCAGVCFPHSDCLHGTHDTHPAVCFQPEEQRLDVAACSVVLSYDSTHRRCLCLLDPEERYAQTVCLKHSFTQLLITQRSHSCTMGRVQRN